MFVAASNAISAPNLDDVNDGKKNRKKDKKLKRSNEDASKTGDENLNESKDSNDTTHSEPIPTTSLDNHSALQEEVNEAQLQKYTILEKCSKQYEVFFQIYLSKCLLNIPANCAQQQCPNVTVELSGGNKLNYFLNDDLIENESRENLARIDNLFATLKITRTSRERKLQSLLNQSIGEDDSNGNESDNKSHSNESLKTINKLLGLKLTLKTRRSVKYASQLLVTFSTIPNYDQTLTIECEEEKKLPEWLKVLALVAAFSKSDKELQIICTSTLFELIDIVRSQSKEKQLPSSCQHLVMIQLLKYGHILYMEHKTRIFQLLVSSLWDYLDFDVSPEIDLSQITILLYRLHSCLESGLVERVISDRIENSHLIWSSSEIVDSDLENHYEDRLSKYKLKRLDDIKVMLNLPEMSATNCSSQLTEKQSNGFRKFELLWHLGREQKESFDKILLKMYDNLALPQHVSIRTFVVKWIKEALLRGDLGRLLMPLLKIMLNPNTKRISISNIHMLSKNSGSRKMSNIFDDTKASDDKNSDIPVENEVYAIKWSDGKVRNHLESIKKKSPIASLPKKILHIATKGSSSEKMREKGLMPSASSTVCNLTTMPAGKLLNFQDI